jgi:hypothetical protein
MSKRGTQTAPRIRDSKVEREAGEIVGGEGTGKGADEKTSPDGVMEVPWNLFVPTADIYLVGYGLRLPNDFTLELLAVLQRCKRIFGLPPLRAPGFKIPEMESLLGLYGPDKKRMQTYREIVELVLEAAATDAPVAFATYGSSMVGTVPAHRILEEAPKRSLTVHVTNAVSSFDGIWADFNIEPFFGFEIWEATVFLRAGIEPDPRKHLLLPQAPLLEVDVGLDTEKMTIKTSSIVHLLRDHLLAFYPPNHRVHYIKTGSGAGPRSLGAEVETLELRDLDHPGWNAGSTLLIPRTTPPGPGRYDFASRAGGELSPRP